MSDFVMQEDEDGRVRGYARSAEPSVLHRLSDARLRADATLDLHGLRSDEARKEVVRFVRNEAGRGSRILRVVHGKGLHSEHGTGVLRNVSVQTLTSTPIASLVLAFAPARREHGGDGVLMILLRKIRPIP